MSETLFLAVPDMALYGTGIHCLIGSLLEMIQYPPATSIVTQQNRAVIQMTEVLSSASALHTA